MLLAPRRELDSSREFDRFEGGEKVAFTAEASPKGPRANQVHAV